MSFFSRKIRPATSGRSPSRRCRLQLELLEDRCLLSAGALDPTFGTGGIVTTALAGTQQGRDIAIYPMGTANAGKTVVAGGLSGGDPQFLLLRYNANGTLDTSFDQDGVVTTNFERNNRYESIDAVAIQPDGKIVAAGTATTNVAGVGAINPSWRLARYNNNGTLDKTFDTDGKVTLFAGAYNTSVRDMLIQPDGKIVVIGVNNGQPVIARFLANGKLDTSFDGDGIATVAASSVNGMVLQTDGKLVIAGSVPEAGTTVSDLADSAFWRLNANGSLDTLFGSGGRVVLSLVAGAADKAVGLAIQSPEGKIVALIDQAAAPGAAVDPGVVTVRIDSAGALDTSYGASGVARTSGAYIAPGKFFVATYEGPGNTALVLQADGKPVVAVQGQYADLNPDGITYSGTTFAGVLRYSRDGVLDNSWASTGQVTGTASGTGTVSGTLHASSPVVTFTAPTGMVTSGDSVTVTFTADHPINVNGAVTGQLSGTFTGSAYPTDTPETWYINTGTGTASGTVSGTVTGNVAGANTVTGAVHAEATGTGATVTKTTTGTIIGTITGAFTGRFASLFTVTGPVTGVVTGGIVHNLAVHGRNHVALQPDGKTVIMGYNADGTDVVLARYLPSAPQIGSFTASPSATAGNPVMLTAADVRPLNPGSTITQVAFYLDSNGDGILDPAADTLLGYGTQTSTGTWTFSFTFSTAGTYKLFAQAKDSYGAFSDPLALSLQVL